MCARCPQVFFFVLLPPIIFDAGFTLNTRLFFSNFGGVLMYAVVGTLISTLIIGFGLFYMQRWSSIRYFDAGQPETSIWVFMQFAALISVPISR